MRTTRTLCSTFAALLACTAALYGLAIAQASSVSAHAASAATSLAAHTDGRGMTF